MEHFFTDRVPAWTNKEVLQAFGSTAAILIPAILALYKFLSSGIRHRLAAAYHATHELKVENDELKKELLASGQPGVPRAELVRLLETANSQHEEARLSAEDLARRLDESVAVSKTRAEHVESLGVAAEAIRGELQQIQGLYGNERRRVERALKTFGFTWTEKVLYSAPDFRPFEDRRMPIISVLNLKGGVGKTTLTANLGAALSRRGWRVLLIDLDLQGSLTNLFLQDEEQKVFEDRRGMIGDFFSRSFDAEFPNLLDYTRPILASTGSAIVPTVDTLAYAETNLTMRWLLREGNRDPRFILRKELHLKRISNAFDIVLLDCPPLINVSCVNALAASDSILIPVLPSKAATDRVPVLLRRLRQIQEHGNHHLKVMGVVANRTFGSELTDGEANRMTELDRKAMNDWGEAIPRFEAIISQSTDVRMAEDEHRPLAEGDRMAVMFDVLAREVESRLPTFCRASNPPISRTAEVIS